MLLCKQHLSQATPGAEGGTEGKYVAFVASSNNIMTASATMPGLVWDTYLCVLPGDDALRTKKKHAQNHLHAHDISQVCNVRGQPEHAVATFPAV